MHGLFVFSQQNTYRDDNDIDIDISVSLNNDSNKTKPKPTRKRRQNRKNFPSLPRNRRLQSLLGSPTDSETDEYQNDNHNNRNDDNGNDNNNNNSNNNNNTNEIESNSVLQHVNPWLLLLKIQNNNQMKEKSHKIVNLNIFE